MTAYQQDAPRTKPAPAPWGQHRIMATADSRYILEVDAVAEVARLNEELARAQAEAAASFSLAEQMDRELAIAKSSLEVLRALASMSLNKHAGEGGVIAPPSSDAEAEAQAWVDKHNDLEKKADQAASDQALLAYLLSSFFSSENAWHWLHVALQGPSPRAALEAAMQAQPVPQPTGVLPKAAQVPHEGT